jgi:hypothetical protein
MKPTKSISRGFPLIFLFPPEPYMCSRCVNKRQVRVWGCLYGPGCLFSVIRLKTGVPYTFGVEGSVPAKERNVCVIGD